MVNLKAEIILNILLYDLKTINRGLIYTFYKKYLNIIFF